MICSEASSNHKQPNDQKELNSCLYPWKLDCSEVVRRSLLVREVWGSYPEPIKSSTRCQRLATPATFEVWALAQSRGDGHRSLVYSILYY